MLLCSGSQWLTSRRQGSSTGLPNPRKWSNSCPYTSIQNIITPTINNFDMAMISVHKECRLTVFLSQSGNNCCFFCFTCWQNFNWLTESHSDTDSHSHNHTVVLRYADTMKQESHDTIWLVDLKEFIYTRSTLAYLFSDIKPCLSVRSNIFSKKKK